MDKPLGVRSQPYTGPFPRKRHSHYCRACGGNAVACYKSQCTRPQRQDVCTWCKPSLITTGGTQ